MNWLKRQLERLRTRLCVWLGINYQRGQIVAQAVETERLKSLLQEYVGHIVTIRNLQFGLADLVKQREATIAALEMRIATLEPKVTAKRVPAKKRRAK